MRVRFENQLQEVWVPCREGEEGWTETSYAVLSDGSELVGPEPISFEDCLRALSDEENDNEQEGTVLQ